MAICSGAFRKYLKKMLASTLDYLMHEGLVVRHDYHTIPPRVEYALTPIANSFLREIGYVIEWGQLHFEEIIRGRR